MRLPKFILLTMLPAALAVAQNTGSISGAVTDETHSAIQRASVALTNLATQEQRRQASNGEGYFIFTNLLPGLYKLNFTADGFAGVTIPEIELTVGQSRRVDAVLQPAAVATQVEVTGEEPPVTVTTASISQLVDQKRVEELPLNGRNPLQLITLGPGTVTVGTSGQYGAVQSVFNVSGGRDIDMNFTLDGGIHMNSFYDIANEYPNPDSLEQFSVVSRNYSAAFGRGTSSVNAVTRSGTNKFHGSLFEFVRNTDLDSRPFFAATRSIFKRNQFGGSVGGPIATNKLFFFAGYQVTKQRGTPGDSSYQTITNPERSGDFSDQPKAIKDPTTNQPFPNNRIPVSRIDPFAANVVSQILPEANSGTNFYRFTPKSQLDQNQLTAKVDYLATAKDHIWFRYFLDDIPQISGNFLRSDFVSSFPTRIQNFTLGYTRTLSSNAVNQLRLSYVRSAYGVHELADFSLNKLGLPLPDANATTAYGLQSESALAISGYFSGNLGAPTRDIATIGQVTDSFSWNKGIHQLSLGFELYKNRLNEIQNFNTGGNLTYSGQTTGNAAADFMLGRFSSLVQASGFALRLRQTLPAMYAQDDMRISRRLTLSLGVRWDPFLPYVSENHALATWKPGIQSTVYPNAPAGLLYPGDQGVPENIIGNHWKNFAPRLGVAWDVRGDGRTSVRAGAGIYFIPLDRSTSYNRFATMQPFAGNITVSGGDTRSIFAGAPFNGVNPLIRPYSSDPTVLATLPFIPAANETALINPYETQQDRQWSLAIEQAIGRSSAVTVSYVGSSAEHLFTTFEANPAVYIPNASTTSNTQQRRLDPVVGSLNAGASALSSNYNSLQVTFSRRYSAGLTILSSYTWSKVLGVNGAQKEGSNGPRDPFNWQLDYGPLPYDAGHSFKTSLVWDVPFAKHISSRAVRLVANGWQAGAILVAQTGFPFSVFSGVDNSFTGIGSDTANQVGDWRIAGGRSKAAEIQHWFNPAAFATNPAGTFGTTGIGILRAPGLLNLDLNVNKRFDLREGSQIELRSSFYNTANHAALGAPNNKANSSTLGQITTAGNPRVIEFALRFRF